MKKGTYTSLGIFFCVLTLGGISLFKYAITARASISDLYASTCLGGWENTHLATGLPSVSDTGGAFFNEQNSAVLRGTVSGHIFCGGFVGDIAQNTVPKNILVKFSWDIRYPEVSDSYDVSGLTDYNGGASGEVADDTGSTEDEDASDEILEEQGEETVTEDSLDEAGENAGEDPLIEETFEAEGETDEGDTMPDSSGESVSEVIDKIPDTLSIPEPESVPTEVEVAPQEAVPSTPVEESASSETVSFWNRLVRYAYAEETTLSDVDLNLNTSEATTTTPSTTPEVLEEESEDNASYGILEVLYTLDGVEWKSLGYVTDTDGADISFEIPISEASAWEDVSKIQISIQRMPLVDTQVPDIYLDAVWLSAQYETLIDESDTTQFLGGVIEAVGGMITPDATTEEEVTEELVDNADEEDTLEGEEETLVEEPTDTEEEFEESPILPQEFIDSLPVLNIGAQSNTVDIDPDAQHWCSFSPFTLRVAENESFVTNIVFYQHRDTSYSLAPVGIPDGYGITLGRDYVERYVPGDSDSEVQVHITVLEGARKGNYSIPFVFTEHGSTDSSAICQLNIINL